MFKDQKRRNTLHGLRKRTETLLLLFLLCTLYGCGGGEEPTKEVTDTTAADAKLHVHVALENTDILEIPLAEDVRYVVTDGVPRAVSFDVTLDSLGDEALPSRHDVNIIEVKDGRVSVIESNCANQVCVGMGALDSDAFDFPIVCLPHRLIITVE